MCSATANRNKTTNRIRIFRAGEFPPISHRPLTAASKNNLQYDTNLSLSVEIKYKLFFRRDIGISIKTKSIRYRVETQNLLVCALRANTVHANRARVLHAPECYLLGSSLHTAKCETNRSEMNFY